MKQVMLKAWEIARNGQKKFGGKVKEYFAEALRMAWSIVKKGMEKVQLKGSEKQVAWAEDIRNDLEKIYFACKDLIIESYKERGWWDDEKRKARALNEMEIIEKEILGNDSAKFFIENFGKFFSKKEREDYEWYLKKLSERFGNYVAREHNEKINRIGYAINKTFYTTL